jgi:two-component system nitrate/nitrite response regulator NarL
MDKRLSPRAAKAITKAVSDLGSTWRGVPMAAIVDLANGVEGRALRIDFAASAQIGAPILVLRERAVAAGLADRLSPREREVVCLIARGFTNKEIARELSISVATVKDHVHHALAKCGMRTRAALAAAAVQTEA